MPGVASILGERFLAEAGLAGAYRRGPVSIYEIAQIVGADYGTSAEPVNKPWNGHMDASLAPSLGFRATVPTAYQAAREGAL